MKNYTLRKSAIACFVMAVILTGCNGGNESTETATNTDSESAAEQAATTLKLTDMSTTHGVAGDSVTLTINEAVDLNTVVIFGGSEITPDSIDGNTVTFTLPAGTGSGPIALKANDVYSNEDWFSISSDGMKPSKQTLTSDSGTEYHSDYLIVQVKASSDNQENADRLAAMVSGTIAGRESDMNWWQIEVSTDSLTALEALQTTLMADSTVENVVIEPVLQVEAIDWSKDPDLNSQRDRNKLEEAAAYYESAVSSTDGVLPFFVAMGVLETGLDFTLDDFSAYSMNEKEKYSNVTLYGRHADAHIEESASGNHGSNVTGIIAATLGNKGNAGLISALSSSHSGANITVGRSASSISETLKMIKNGATVINWSWGLHKVDHHSTAGDIEQSEVDDAPRNCMGNFVVDNNMSSSQFNPYKTALNKFFSLLETKYPNVVIVTSAGNGYTNAGDTTYRLPSSIVNDQLIVVGAHTSGASFSSGLNEDTLAGQYCFDTETAKTVDVKRAFYSNYGDRVDISASGTIVGFQNNTTASAMGTSYATPAVAATVAMMQSINPELTPSEIKSLLRQSSMPIENEVKLSDGGTDVFTRALTPEESSANAGKGARLDAEAALKAALVSLGTETLDRSEPVDIKVPESGEITQTITVQIPGDASSIYDKADITFLVDVSGSYYDDITTFRNQANALVTEFDSIGNDVTVGVASFSDFDFASYGSSNDYAYSLDLPLTTDHTKVQTTLDNLSILGGGNVGESQLEALYQLATGKDVGWRQNSLPVIFLATDAGFNNSDTDTRYPGHGWAETTAALQAKGIKVFGLMAGGDIADVKEIATETGGETFTLSRNSSEVVSAVASALDLTTQNMSIELQTVGDFAGVVKKIVPTDNPTATNGTAVTNVNPGDTVSFDVTFTKGNFNGSKAHVLSFRLLVNVDGVATIQEVPVTIEIN